MQCPKGEELTAYVDGELRPARAKQIASHIVACPRCAETAVSLQAVRHLLLSQPRPKAEAWFAERTAGRVAELLGTRQLKTAPPKKTAAWAIAAALTLCVGSACLITRPWNWRDDPLLARCVERFEQGVEQKDGGIGIERCTSPWDAVLGEEIP